LKVKKTKAKAKEIKRKKPKVESRRMFERGRIREIVAIKDARVGK